jgi:hypothetical protein
MLDVKLQLGSVEEQAAAFGRKHKRGDAKKSPDRKEAIVVQMMYKAGGMQAAFVELIRRGQGRIEFDRENIKHISGQDFGAIDAWCRDGWAMAPQFYPRPSSDEDHIRLSAAIGAGMPVLPL